MPRAPRKRKAKAVAKVAPKADVVPSLVPPDVPAAPEATASPAETRAAEERIAKERRAADAEGALEVAFVEGKLPEEDRRAALVVASVPELSAEQRALTGFPIPEGPPPLPAEDHVNKKPA